MRSPVFSLILLALLSLHAAAQVVFNEIHYHPVERPAFDASGNPVYQGTTTPADLTDDVHEFLELYNPGAAALDLSGWRIEGGVDFTFPAGSSIPATGYLVVAKNPARIQAVYGIAGVLGPYTGKLSNSGDSLRLVTPTNAVMDAVSYGTNSPWAISANQLGASSDFTLLDSTPYQYKGRSLQRVSATAPSNDPANWVAVRPASGTDSFADLPTPGAANIVTRPVPKPVVIARSATQATDGSIIIRSTANVTVLARFSSSAALSSVEVEYFVDNMNVFDEARTSVPMTPLGNDQYSATLPPQANRSIVRYRIKANRGDGSEVVSPRPDDPAVVATGLTAREPWHAYFVTPVRTSAKPIYDCIVSTDGKPVSDTTGGNNYPFNGINGLQNMAYNATGNLKRVTSTGVVTASYPRELGWPGVVATSRIWNGTVPAVFVENGNVRDIQLRFHGSRYNRNPSRKSYKMNFLDYQFYQGADSVFITDKGDAFTTAHGLHQFAGLPISNVRYVDWYFNTDGVQTRLEQGEYNGDLLNLYHEKMQRLNPGSVKEQTGEYYKSVGVITGGGPTTGEGPYGVGNGFLLPATGGTPSWTDLQRYDYTYTLQNHAWKGAKPIKDMLTGMWAARGDTYSSPNPNIVNTKAWFNQNWDVDTELTSLSVGNWMCPWDDTTQNYFLWRRANGKYVRVLWDFDAMYGVGDNTSATSPIYTGEVGSPGNNSRGPNYIKDSFIKAFRAEYQQRMWFMNNTLLEPESLKTLTYKNSAGTTTAFYTYINSQAGGFAVNRFNSVNTQVAKGVFYKPTRPTNTSPTNAAAVLPGTNFTSSPYGYDATYTHAAAPTVSPHTKSKWEIRASTGTYDDPVFVLTTTTDLTSLAIPFGQLTFGQTYFWRVTYYDADGHPSITSLETSFSYGASSPTAGSITINEVMAENLTAVSNGADRPDYIELKNNSAGAIDLGGWSLTDDDLLPTKYSFPAGTSVPAGGYQVVWCDSRTSSPGLHTGFALSRKGQRVILVQGGKVQDAISFGPQAPNSAIGRVIDGSGGWTLVDASPGAVNTARPFSTATTSLKINEWMAVPATGEDWFEIYNSDTQPVSLANLWLSDTPGTPRITQIPALSFVGPGGCVRFDADGSSKGFNSANFKLSTGGDHLMLIAADGSTIIDTVDFGLQQPGVSQGRFPDGSANITNFPLSASPNDNNWLPAQVRINEALSNSTAPFQDYVEIYNPTGAAVDLSKWWLSDDHFSRQKYQFPDGTSIPAGGYLVVNENQFNLGASAFALSSTGDEVVLTAADATGVPTGFRSQFNFGPAGNNVPFGYVATAGAPEFWPQVSPTPGAANSAPVIGPVVINEIHYHPPDVSGGDSPLDEYVELHNITTSPVNLTGWKLKGGGDFAFTAGTTLRAGDYILLVTFNPTTDPGSLAAFRTALNVPTNVPIYGPFSPKLANDTQSVELAYPGGSVGGVTPFINVDKVEYLDVAPWPIAPDGTGASLQRVSRQIIGNDPGNWTGTDPTPGAVNTGETAIVDNDGDSLPNTWEDANGLDKFDSADAVADADGDGQSNGAEYVSGTNPQDATDVLSVTVNKAPNGPGFSINFHAKAGRTYVLEFKNALSDVSWQMLTNIPAPAVDADISYTDPTLLSQRFYHAKTSGP